ncbi:NAD-dependent epimerase/dehydratase family protein [Chloroflexota bacterium]
MKKILIVGGSYFVGRVFVEELLNYGEYDIYVMNRGNRPLKLEGVREIVCDRHDTGKLSKVLLSLQWDTVVDFCAYKPEDIEMMIKNLPESVRQYIYISTATVYQNSLALPMKEDTPKLTSPMPGPHGDYGYNKWLTELKLKELCSENGIAHVSLRPTFIYGKYNYAPRESYFFNLIAKGESIVLPLPPQALLSMVSVWDVAKICVACLGNDKVFNKAYTVSAEELISYDKLIEVLEAITSKKLSVQRQPIRVIDERRIPLPFPLEEHLIYSGSLLQETLNYKYMSFLEGMTKTYNWFFQTIQKN